MCSMFIEIPQRYAGLQDILSESSDCIFFILVCVSRNITTLILLCVFEKHKPICLSMDAALIQVIATLAACSGGLRDARLVKTLGDTEDATVGTFDC